MLNPRRRDPYDPKIFLLPNLMTAGNLFCGFAATLEIITGTLVQVPVTGLGKVHDLVWSKGAIDRFHDAIWFILAACVFDVLDGRLARLGGQDSPFGREFDSLADTVSFGIAPALLVYKIVLEDPIFGRLGMLIAFLYLACGTMRLARFNCIAVASEADHGAQSSPDQKKNFKGFPIPAAAGVIASLTELLLWFDQDQRQIGAMKYALPPLMIFLSFMMFSEFKYPSFKAINWRTQRTLPALLVIMVLILFTAFNYQWMPAVIFLSYLMYGFLRPWLSRPWRRSIEQEIGMTEEGEEDDDDEDEDLPAEENIPRG